jgi:hypothetical protein
VQANYPTHDCIGRAYIYGIKYLTEVHISPAVIVPLPTGDDDLVDRRRVRDRVRERIERVPAGTKIVTAVSQHSPTKLKRPVTPETELCARSCLAIGVHEKMVTGRIARKDAVERLRAGVSAAAERPVASVPGNPPDARIGAVDAAGSARS